MEQGSTPKQTTAVKQAKKKRDIVLPDSGPRLEYELMLERGEISLDRSQLRVVRALQRVYENLKESEFGEKDHGDVPRVTLVERARLAAEANKEDEEAMGGFQQSELFRSMSNAFQITSTMVGSTLSQSVMAARNPFGSKGSSGDGKYSRDLKLTSKELQTRLDLIAVDGILYDLDAFAPKHPGGDAIRLLKGTDATLAFYKLHPDYMVKRAKRRLEEYKVGELVDDGTADGPATDPADVEVPDRGLYVYGGPGCGKTMLMDMFYDCLETDKKRRVHFHEFMVFVHRTLHKLKEKHNSNALQTGPVGTTELFLHMADEFREDCKVLCLDEFMVTDVADALIMRQLFDALWRSGVVLVATSNRATGDLYKNGLQREVFLPFLDKLEQHCKEVQLRSALDYRQEKNKRIRSSLQGSDHEVEHHFLVRQLNDAGIVIQNPKFEALWNTLTTPGTTVQLAKLQSFGRNVELRMADTTHRVSRVPFEQLCQDDTQPMGVADYGNIAKKFDTVFVEDVPIVSLEDLDTLRRFVSFVDVMYDQNVVLVMDLHAPVSEIIDMMGATDEESAGRLVAKQADIMGDEYLAQTVHDLDNPGEVGYQVDSETSSIDEAFAVSRTLSRLIEMETEEYAIMCREKRKPVLPV